MTAQNTQVTNTSQRKPEGSPQKADETHFKTVLPAVDIFEDEDKITILADMPGVKKDGLSLQLEGDVLSVEGIVSIELPEKLVPLYNEFGGERFARSFTLSHELDASRIDAKLNEGVLTVFIPKAEALRARKIDVKFGQQH